MSEHALIAEVRRQAQQDIERAWREARLEIEARRATSERLVAEARATADRAHRELTAACQQEADAAAESTARRIRAEARAALEARLYSVAASQLQRFRGERYPELFARLVADLPDRRWERAYVHPDDEALARACLPGVEIVGDRTVEAGLAVETANGRVRVTNTLRTRLDAAWPDLVTALMRDLREELARS